MVLQERTGVRGPRHAIVRDTLHHGSRDLAQRVLLRVSLQLHRLLEMLSVHGWLVLHGHAVPIPAVVAYVRW